ncbi:MAG: B12-binding domain-containing radical SAM protein [Candidatus Riflebacteria bacterium]|nr:B12-binding domain-containing radical SAM protein [Candidatus Riflebacteria bacterium]
MSSPDILLVSPPLLWNRELRPDMKQPLNLLYLASWLNAAGVEAQVLDAVIEELSLPQILQKVSELQPRFVGIPFYQATRNTALELCAAIRREQPHIWLVAGGPLATTSAESLLSHSEIDFCVIGEGEITLEELLRSDLPLHRHEKPDYSCLANIAGLAFRNSEQKVFTAERSPIADLDKIPFVDFNLINIKKYFAYHSSIDMSDWLFLTTSRGCHARCVFCATPVLWPGGMRRKSVTRLLEEIAFQRKRYPTAHFGFMDDSFFSDKAWLKDFFAGISTMSAKYCCIGRADHLTEEDVAGLAASGCIYVAIGIETGNQLRQKKLKKYLDLERVKASVKLLKHFGVFCKGFFMLGFPDETPQEMLETINFAVELSQLGMGECSFFPVSIYPGTELAEQFPEACRASKVYESGDSVQNPDDFAETRMQRYANIPDANINAYFTAEQILRIVRFAYHCVEAGSQASPADLTAASEL